MADIIGVIYIDKDGRNNVEKKETLQVASQKTYKYARWLSHFRVALVYEFLEMYVIYGIDPKVRDSILQNDEQELVPKLMLEYIKRTHTGLRHEKEEKDLFANAMKDLFTDKMTEDKSVGATYGVVRGRKAFTIELGLCLLVAGSIRNRDACNKLDDQGKTATHIGILELGDIGFVQNGKPTALTNPFFKVHPADKVQDQDSTKQLMTDATTYYAKDQGRSITRTFHALFGQGDYDGPIVVDVEIPDEPKKKGKKKGAKRKKDGEDNETQKKKKKKTKTKKTDDKMDVDACNAQEQQEEDGDGAKTVNVSVQQGDVMSTSRDELQDKKFIRDILDGIGVDTDKLEPGTLGNIVGRMINHFGNSVNVAAGGGDDASSMNANDDEDDGSVTVESEDDHGKEQDYYNAHLGGMVTGDYNHDELTDMKQVLEIAYRNSKMRVKKRDEYYRGYNVRGHGKFAADQREKFDGWEKQIYDNEEKSVIEKMESFAMEMEIGVKFISAVKDQWTVNEYNLGKEPFYTLTILAKTKGEGLSNDQTTTYEYFVPERPSE